MPDLFAIGEYPDLYADSCCANGDDDCLFLSLWGRDTVIQEVLARLMLPVSQNGLDTLHLSESEATYRVRFRDIENYEKRTTRAFQKTRFGSLVQVWLFDRRCVSPDLANLEAVMLIERVEPQAEDRLWQRVKHLCPLPLLDHWQSDVMSWLHQQKAILPAHTSLGRLCAWEIRLDQNAMAVHLSELIRTGVLTTEP